MKVNLPKVEEETRVELNIIKARRGDPTLSDTLSYLVRAEKENGELKQKIAVFEKENSMLQEIRELIIPIPRPVMDSTPEEIDSLELSEGGLMVEMEKRIKRFWKRFAKKEEEKEIE